MSGDITRVNQWLYSTFSSNQTLNNLVGGRIYGDMAPQGAAFPLVLFAFLGGSDKVITFTNRFTNAIYLVRAAAKGSSFSAVEDIADRIDALITNVPDNGIIVRDILISSCVREQPHQRKDVENGIPMVYVGGFYRIKYQPHT